MTWGKFFHSRPCKHAAVACTLGLAAGSLGSLICALYLAKACSHALEPLQADMSAPVDISELNADIPIKNYTATITLQNIVFKIPSNFLDMLDNGSDQISNYCFNITLILGICLVAIPYAWNLGNTAFIACLYQRQEELEEILRQHVLLKEEGRLGRYVLLEQKDEEEGLSNTPQS